MNTNVLLLTPYSFTNYGGVQNQVNLIEEYLDNHHQFNVKVFAHGKIDSLNNEKIYKKVRWSAKNFFKEFKLVYCLTLLRIDHSKKNTALMKTKQ